MVCNCYPLFYAIAQYNYLCKTFLWSLQECVIGGFCTSIINFSPTFDGWIMSRMREKHLRELGWKWFCSETSVNYTINHCFSFFLHRHVFWFKLQLKNVNFSPGAFYKVKKFSNPLTWMVVHVGADMHQEELSRCLSFAGVFSTDANAIERSLSSLGWVGTKIV